MLPLRKQLKASFAKQGTVSSYLCRDPVIQKSLSLRTKRGYKFCRVVNGLFSLAIFIPVIGSIWHFNLPNFVGYLLCVAAVYGTWLTEALTGATILEETRFITIYSVMLHSVFGVWLGFYDRFEIYDSILHFNGGVWLAFLVFPFVLGIELTSSSTKKPALFWKVNLYTIALVNLLGILWEIGEFISDQIFSGSPDYSMAQEGNFDTMTDIILNNAGAVIGLWILWRLLGRNSELDTLLERIGKALRDFANGRHPEDGDTVTTAQENSLIKQTFSDLKNEFVNEESSKMAQEKSRQQVSR